MDLTFLSHINYLAITASSILFFLLGSFWFSGLFGPLWIKELEKHNVIIKQPTNNAIYAKMALTFFSNVITSLAMAYLVTITYSTTFQSGLVLGLIASIGFAATTLAGVFVWESRSLTLFLIDIGYPVLGIIMSAIILSLWHY